MSSLALCGLCSALAVFAQPAFEVASVKPTRLENIAHDAVRFAPGGRFTASSMTLKGLIRLAYDVQGYQVSGGPAWLDSDRFDVDTKADGNPDHARLLLMMQGLLAERFRLKLHRETRELPAYWLVASKTGAKISETRDVPFQFRFGPGHAEWDAATMVQVANYLAGKLGRAVLDKTELRGRYALKLAWEPDPNVPESALIFSAVEQLGLRLEPRKDAIEVLLVDHAEAPSEN